MMLLKPYSTQADSEANVRKENFRKIAEDLQNKNDEHINTVKDYENKNLRSLRASFNENDCGRVRAARAGEPDHWAPDHHHHPGNQSGN